MGRGRMRRIHRSWPVAALLVVLLVLDLPLDGDSVYNSYYDVWWVLPCAVPLIVSAVLASRWPFESGVAAAWWLLASSMLVHLGDILLFWPMTFTEVVAVAVIITAAVRSAPAWTAACLAGLLTVTEGAAAVIRWGWPESFLGLRNVVTLVIIAVTPVVVGLYLRSGDRATARAAREVVLAAQRRERVELARELHDVVAFHVGGVVVQAQAAQCVADAAMGARLLPVVEKAGADALAAMRRMVAMLDDGDPAGGAPVRTMDLDADLLAVTAAVPGGTPVRLTIDAAEPIPAVVATSVLRLVQESVANARRHAAGAREIAVAVRTGDGTVRVTVRDDGRPGGEPRRHGGGFGLVGMRERVQLLGGGFTAGRAPGGGWQVTADLPLGEPA